MNNLEIERKYLVRKMDITFDYKKYPCEKIVQGFIYLKPAIRIRKLNDKYYLTIKSAAPKNKNVCNDLVRTEYEIEISRKVYNDLSKLCKGRLVYKTRYLIPYKYHRKQFTIEFDVFEKDLKGLFYAEVEFKNVKEANTFSPPCWFFKDVTGKEKYKNTKLSICKNVKNVLIY